MSDKIKDDEVEMIDDLGFDDSDSVNDEVTEEDEAMAEAEVDLSPAEEREVEESLKLADGSNDHPGFLPEVDENSIEEETPATDQDFSGTELEAYEVAEIEDVEFIETDQLESIVESILFASDRPVSMASIRQVFQGTSVKKKQITDALNNLAITYADGKRGVTLEEVTGGYQLRTKVDNMDFLKKTVKGRPFRLSGPALEVLAIAAYKQPLVKVEIDEIRGVESGHLLRALMEKGLVSFAGKSELPGKPMLYQTTKKFLEIFGLRNIKELPSLSEIDNLLPEGIGDEEDKETLSDITQGLSENSTDSYSIGEEELGKISDQLSAIETSTDFFEDEKRRQKEKRDKDRAQDILDALEMGEEVEEKDKRWLARYEQSIEDAKLKAQEQEEASDISAADGEDVSTESETPLAEETASANEEAALAEPALVLAAEAEILQAADAESLAPEATDALGDMQVSEDQETEAAPAMSAQEATEILTAETGEAAVTEKTLKKAGKKVAGAEHADVVNEKLAKALAAFRTGFSDDNEADSETKEDKARDADL